MLTHIVIWKYRADVEPDVRAEHVALLRRLASVIPEVQSWRSGSTHYFCPGHTTRVWWLLLLTVRGLDAYTVHPEHIKVAEFGSTISAQVASVDFES